MQPKETITITRNDDLPLLDFILLNGEERLRLIFFGQVSIPKVEWGRRIAFRESLDQEIRNAKLLSLPKVKDYSL
jgi:hypothetical protein